MGHCEHVYSMLSDIVIGSSTRFIKPSGDHHLCIGNMHENGLKLKFLVTRMPRPCWEQGT